MNDPMRLAPNKDPRALTEEELFAAGKTPFEIIAKSAQKYPDAIAIRYVLDAESGEEVTYTYQEFYQAIGSCAKLFNNLGITQDQSVAVLGPHTPAVQIALWGAELYCAATPINSLLNTDHIISIIKNSNAGCIVLSEPKGVPPFVDELLKSLHDEKISLPILLLDNTRSDNNDCLSFDDEIKKVILNDDEIAFRKPTDIAAYYHTGGTTGAPKLVQHLQQNQAHVAISCAKMFGFEKGDILLNGFPIFHVAGAFVYGLSIFSVGGTLLIPGPLGMRNRDFLGNIWQMVEKYGINLIGAVPTILTSLNSIDINADISSLKLILTGGSPLPPELARAVENKTSKPVRNIYGMTETAGCIAVDPYYLPRENKSCGYALPLVEVRAVRISEVIDPEARVGQGEEGLLIIKGPNVANGYKGNAGLNDTFIGDGWLASGDMGSVDKDGRIYITGRSKDIIIRGSHNIDPQSIEDSLVSHAEVQDAAAVGYPDAYAGELPVAFVVLKECATVTEAALIEYVSGVIEDKLAVPKKIFFKEALPVTPVGKVFKPALREILIVSSIQQAALKKNIELSEKDVILQKNGTVIISVAEESVDSVQEALAGLPVDYTFTIS